MEKIVVGIAEGKVVSHPGVLVSYALGSCVGICLYDQEHRIAGMAHIMLPSQEDSLNRDNPYKFADSGLHELVTEMRIWGADTYRLTAKIAGGAEMFRYLGTRSGIGRRNVEAVKKALEAARIQIIGEDTGKDFGRTIAFSTQDGSLEIRKVNRIISVL